MSHAPDPQYIAAWNRVYHAMSDIEIGPTDPVEAEAAIKELRYQMQLHLFADLVIEVHQEREGQVGCGSWLLVGSFPVRQDARRRMVLDPQGQVRISPSPGKGRMMTADPNCPRCHGSGIDPDDRMPGNIMSNGPCPACCDRPPTLEDIRDTIISDLTDMWDGLPITEEAATEMLDRLVAAVQRTDAAKIRAEVPRGYCPCADLIDPDKETP